VLRNTGAGATLFHADFDAAFVTLKRRIRRTRFHGIPRLNFPVTSVAFVFLAAFLRWRVGSLGWFLSEGNELERLSSKLPAVIPESLNRALTRPEQPHNYDSGRIRRDLSRKRSTPAIPLRGGSSRSLAATSENNSGAINAPQRFLSG